MNIEISVQGIAAADASIDALVAKLEDAAGLALTQVALAIEKTAKTGLTQVQNNTKGGHIGPPGGFPNRRTGALARSIMTHGAIKGFNGYEASVSAGMVYARQLEEGWASGVNYPYMAPSAAYVIPQIANIFTATIKQYWS